MIKLTHYVDKSVKVSVYINPRAVCFVMQTYMKTPCSTRIYFSADEYTEVQESVEEVILAIENALRIC